MIALINELTDMPKWYRKIFDKEFTFKWESEKVMSGNDIYRSMADWVADTKFPIFADVTNMM